MTKIAMCRTCPDTPLISTFHWPGAEFYCLDCGAHLGWLEPCGAAETPELLARLRALEAEWKENAGPKLLTQGAWLRGCPRCDAERDYNHAGHATVEEHAAHEAAVAWIAKRRSEGAART